MLGQLWKQIVEVYRKTRDILKYNPLGSLLIITSLLILFWISLETYRANNMGFSNKSFWDWMDLLIVPFVLVIGAYLFNRAERNIEQEAINRRAKTEHETSQNQAREIALQSYLDHMTELMIENGLRKSSRDDEVRIIARVRTLTALDQLDGSRKAILLRFLYEAGLISIDNPVVDLQGANLSKLILFNINISDCNLSGANLRGAQFVKTDMNNVRLNHADLTESNLAMLGMEGADLTGANTIGASFTMVDLRNAKLCGTRFKGISPNALSFEEAEKIGPVTAKFSYVNFRGAKYDDDTKWPDTFDPVDGGAVRVEQKS